MTERTEMNRSSLRTMLLHRRLATRLDERSLSSWRPQILENLERIRSTLQGHPHVKNLDRWQHIVESSDVRSLRTVLTSSNPDPDSVQMREVSPMGGLITQEERRAVLESLPGR